MSIYESIKLFDALSSQRDLTKQTIWCLASFVFLFGLLSRWAKSEIKQRTRTQSTELRINTGPSLRKAADLKPILFFFLSFFFFF